MSDTTRAKKLFVAIVLILLCGVVGFCLSMALFFTYPKPLAHGATRLFGRLPARSLAALSRDGGFDAADLFFGREQFAVVTTGAQPVICTTSALHKKPRLHKTRLPNQVCTKTR